MVAVAGLYLLRWPDTAYATLCIPIIRRLIPNTSVKRNTPTAGFANTVKDTAKDKIPTPTRKPFDHFEIFLSEMP